MNIQQEIKAFQEKINPEIERYLDEAISCAKQEDVFLADLLGRARSFILAGGKRLRGALLYEGFILAGGEKRQEEDILKVCVGIELTHAFFLVHDDIMDRDEMRHGVPTLHREFAAVGERLFPKEDTRHFGISMAITAGDLLGAMGSQCLFSTRFSPERVVRALKRLQESISRTGLGQAMDVHMEYMKKATEEKVLSMYKNKTARYTVECPLHLGAILAGAEDALLEALSRYALPIGVAFQLQDDLLGAFGVSNKTGKAVGSDIQEGKMTLLVVKALEMGTLKDKKYLRNVLGNGSSVSEKALQRVQDIFRGTGALAYVTDFSARLVEEGRCAIEDIHCKSERSRLFLMNMAEYISKRTV